MLLPEIVSLYRILWRGCKAVGPLAPVSISIQFLFPVSSTIVRLHGGSHIDKKKKSVATLIYQKCLNLHAEVKQL